MLKVDPDGSVNRVCGQANQISNKRFQHNKETSPQANAPAAINGEQQLLVRPVVMTFIVDIRLKDIRY